MCVMAYRADISLEWVNFILRDDSDMEVDGCRCEGACRKCHTLSFIQADTHAVW